MEKEIVILAKSNKRGGFCVAGIDTNTGEWIRPISNNSLNEGAVPKEDLFYEDYTEVKIFDKVKIQFLSHAPSLSQPENYIYDSSDSWVKTGTSTLDEIINFRGYDDTDQIFYNASKSVNESELNGGPSLLLLNIENPSIYVKTFEKKKIQLNFDYNRRKYQYLQVSDPKIIESYSSKNDGSYQLNRNLHVVFSLTDKYDKTDKYYKMAAQIFQK